MGILIKLQGARCYSTQEYDMYPSLVFKDRRIMFWVSPSPRDMIDTLTFFRLEKCELSKTTFPWTSRFPPRELPASAASGDDPFNLTGKISRSIRILGVLGQ
jgi:hypothetical protein